MKKWKEVQSKEVYKCPRFSIFEDDVILPDGLKGKYYYHKSGSAVGVIAYDGKKIYLVNQYRYAVKKRLWEIPIGKAEDKNYLVQAKKELREETGISAENWKFLGSFYPSPGRITAQAKLFLAKDLTFGEHDREGSESDMVMKGFTLKQINNMIIEGKIVDGWSLSALHVFKLKSKIL